MGDAKACPRPGCKAKLVAPVTPYDGASDEHDLHPFGMARSYCSPDCMLLARESAMRRRAQAKARAARIRQEAERELGP